MAEPLNHEDIELDELEEYPGSAQTVTRTVSFQSEPRYSSYWSDAVVRYESGESVFVGEAVRATILPQNLPLPVTPVVPPLSMFPLNRTEFLLQLPQQDIDRLLQPVKQGILSVDTVFSIKDVNTDISMAISAIEMMEILEANGRSISLLNDEPLYDEIKPPKSKKKVIALVLFIVLIIAAIIGLTLGLLLKLPQPTVGSYGIIENSSDSVFLIFGGLDRVHIDGGIKVLATNTVELYYPHNPSLNYMLNETMIIPRVAGVAANMDDVIVLAGGSNDTFKYCIPECEIYNLTDSTFQLGPSLNQPRVFAAGAMYQSVFYICGGYDSTKTEPQFTSCEKLTSSLKKWELIASMNRERRRPSLGIFNNMFSVFGGDMEQQSSNIDWIIETYNVSNDSWNQWNHSESVPQCAFNEDSGFGINSHAIFLDTPWKTSAILYETQAECSPCLLEEGKKEWNCLHKLNGWYLPANSFTQPVTVQESRPSEMYSFPTFGMETDVARSMWRKFQNESGYGFEWNYVNVTHMIQARSCALVVSL